MRLYIPEIVVGLGVAAAMWLWVVSVKYLFMLLR